MSRSAPTPAHDTAVEKDTGDETIAIGAGLDFADPNSPLARYYLRSIHVAVIALLGGLFVILNFVPLRQTDVWGHLRFGKYVFENLELPRGNPFCPLQAGEVPSNHYSWLSQTVFYAVYHGGELLAGGDELNRIAGGVDLLRFSQALMVVGRLLLFWFAFWRLTGSCRLALIGVLLTCAINLGGSLVIFRPQLIAELCFAALLFALAKVPLSRLALFGVPVLMVLWANLHGSFVIGFAMLGACCAGRIIETAWAQRTIRPRQLLADAQVRALGIAVLASLLAVAALNPVGPAVFAQALDMAKHPVVLVMDEWEPMRLQGGPGGQYGYMITLVILIGSLIYARGRITPTAVLLILVFGLQPLKHQRALIWWYAVLPWIVLPLWVRGRSQLVANWLTSHSEPNFRKTLVAVALVFVCLLWSIPGLWCLDGHPAPVDRTLSQGTPWRLAEHLEGGEPWLPELDRWLHANYPHGRFRGPIFTSETAGDYLVWSLPEDMPVFAYAHVHLLTWEHWQQVAAVRNGTVHWRTVLDHHRINLLVVEAELNKRLRGLLYQDKEWQVIYDEYEDPQVYDFRCRLLVAVRKTPLR